MMSVRLKLMRAEVESLGLSRLVKISVWQTYSALTQAILVPEKHVSIFGTH